MEMGGRLFVLLLFLGAALAWTGPQYRAEGTLGGEPFTFVSDSYVGIYDQCINRFSVKKAPRGVGEVQVSGQAYRSGNKLWTEEQACTIAALGGLSDEKNPAYGLSGEVKSRAEHVGIPYRIVGNDMAFVQSQADALLPMLVDQGRYDEFDLNGKKLTAAAPLNAEQIGPTLERPTAVACEKVKTYC
jgi:hypothetical protein